MAVAYVNSSATAALNPTTGNFDLPAGWAAGDLAIFWWYARSNAKSFTNASGGKVTQQQATDTVGQGALFIGYRMLQAGDQATDMAWTATSSASTDVVYGTIILTSVDGTTPIEADSGTPTAFINTQSPDPPSVAVATDGAAVVTLYGKNNDSGASVTPPSGYSDGGHNESTAGSDASGGLAYKLGVAAGTEDPGAWTLGGAGTDDGFTWTGSVKPAAGGGATITYPELERHTRGVERGVLAGVA